LAKNDVAVLEPFFNKLQENTTQRFILGRGMWVHGATTPWEYFKMFQAYSLAERSEKYSVSNICGEAENDRRRGGGKDLYNALQCPKEYVLFTRVKALASTARRARARYFFKKCLVARSHHGQMSVWLTMRRAT
jgi:hypothetical protein